MADLKIAYATSTALTVTLAALATATARESTAVDNTTTTYLDALVAVTVKLQTGTPASEKSLYVYAYGSEDGTTYTDNATGTDAAVTLRSPTNFKLIGAIACPDSGGLTYRSGPMSVASAFGGVLPRQWGIVVRNLTNVTLSATAADHSASYTGVYTTVV